MTRTRARAQRFRSLSDSALRTSTDSLRDAVGRDTDTPSEEILESGFALVCEAARRTVGIEYYDVQLLAGLALSRKAIAEMHTGEGKTFVAALPALVFALAGRGVHVMTVNAYLAQRDYQLLAPLYELLGVSVGSISRQAPAEEKRAAYGCDITYGPGYEFGFDYLRDQAALFSERKPALGESLLKALHGEPAPGARRVQRGHEMAIVDEIDSVLIDEATSPLVLSDAPRRLAANAGVYIGAMRLANSLETGIDFVVDSTTRVVHLTEKGAEKACNGLKTAANQALQRPWATYVEQALRAHLLLKRDADYVVDDDKILLVDESTGRIFSDRSLRQGLHQAVEAKEKVPITVEQQALARISRQRYFRLYRGVCGMTGTATGNEREFWALYRTPVIRIPLRRPCRRSDLPTRFFADQDAKWAAIGTAAKETHKTGQPILVGTRTIDRSFELANRFDSIGIPYQLLNGTQDADEADVVAQAGRVNAVTIATNMAGRGTDIKLGPGAETCGGLHVMVTEPHDSARVDRQLIGRSARQSDPGSYQRFVAADDPLVSHHATSLGHRMKHLANGHGEIMADLSTEVRRAQRKAEQLGYVRRRQLLVQDEWLEGVLSELAEER